MRMPNLQLQSNSAAQNSSNHGGAEINLHSVNEGQNGERMIKTTETN
jgi:hypothetical protein